MIRIVTAKRRLGHVRNSIVWLAVIACLGLVPSGRAQGRKTLDVYFIDVEGGQSTLFVTPAGEAVLVDAGNPGGRDSGRVVAAIKAANLKQIDYMVVTHFDSDHMGGVSEVAQQIPIKNFVDHGPRRPIPGQNLSGAYKASLEKLDGDYNAAWAKANHIVVKPGDKVPVRGLDWDIMTAQEEHITAPLKGGGAPNPLCADYQPVPVVASDDRNSVGMVISMGRFRMLDLGDLPWNYEHNLVCPNNLLGKIDVYLTTAHGLALSSLPAMVKAITPRVVVMNNAAKKGDSKESWMTYKSTPSVEDIWQVHRAAERPAQAIFNEKSNPGGTDGNAPEQFIANLEEPEGHTTVYTLKLSAKEDGSITVTNPRNGFKKDYPAPKKTRP
jgi:competence protein ComEC